MKCQKEKNNLYKKISLKLICLIASAYCKIKITRDYYEMGRQKMFFHNKFKNKKLNYKLSSISKFKMVVLTL